MAYNAQLADRIRALVADRESHVEEKHMFGGICFMVRGKMCVTTREDHIMVRVSPEQYELEVLGEGCRPMVHGGREMKGFIFVSEDVVRTTGQLKRWVDMALDYNREAQASGGKAAKKTTKAPKAVSKAPAKRARRK
jgi:TfoX/Sxy family transcriptional regulator of competence genes